MRVEDAKDKLPKDLFDKIIESGIEEFRPAQKKAIDAGLLDGENLLITTPTASGKTLIGEMALVKTIMEGRGKGLYVVPLRALASEKFNQFREKYKGLIRIGVSTGDLDDGGSDLSNYDLIFVTSEKVDSLLRHRTSWMPYVKCVVVDEIHLLNDIGRGPTLEVVLTLLRHIVPDMQIIGLSATIGNPKELAYWLCAKLVEDTWRPVVLEKGVYYQGKVEFVK